MYLLDVGIHCKGHTLKLALINEINWDESFSCALCCLCLAGTEWRVKLILCDSDCVLYQVQRDNNYFLTLMCQSPRYLAAYPLHSITKEFVRKSLALLI